MELGRYYPVGIQSFSKIREMNAVYVDKTALIYRLTHTSNCVFLSRPRRFGKSLLSSTLACYFEGRKELFEGLAMEQYEKDWTRYPVFHFDLSTAKGLAVSDVIGDISLQLMELEQLYGRVPEETTLGMRLNGLIRRAYKQTGKQVVVIVDEYDAPLLEVLHDDDGLQEVRQLMKEFYAPLKRCDAYLRFVFITGITKFSQLSIFSTLNSLRNISMLDEYAAICGITESELHQYFDEDMPGLASSLGITPEEAMRGLKELYDGYHFSGKSEEIYNPFSLLSALNDKSLKTYWFGTGTPGYLMLQLKRFQTDVTTLEHIEASEFDFDVPTEAMVDALPLLYQSGYLTIKNFNLENQTYVLGIPNREVRLGLVNNLLPAYTSLKSSEVRGLVIRFCDALRMENLEQALQILRSYLAGIPYMSGDKAFLEEEEKAEAHYHLLFYLIFSFMNDQVLTEVRSAQGRSDVVMFTPHAIYVFELKINRPAQEALDQINRKGYALPYETDARPVVKVGIRFSTSTRTIEEWVIS
jgi:hypothetical protein